MKKPVSNPMRILFNFTGLLAVGSIFWALLGFLMDLPSFRYSLPLALLSVLLFFLAGILKIQQDRRAFEAFLEEKRRDQDLQRRIAGEKVEAGDKTGRSGVYRYPKERNAGLNWTGASVHGAVPRRKKRRSFLPKNR